MLSPHLYGAANDPAIEDLQLILTFIYGSQYEILYSDTQFANLGIAASYGLHGGVGGEKNVFAPQVLHKADFL